MIKAIIKSIDKLLKRILQDTNGGFLDTWLFVIFGLTIELIVFVLVIPITNLLGTNMIELGAPVSGINWIRKSMAWSLGIMGAGLIIYGIARSYRIEYDN